MTIRCPHCHTRVLLQRGRIAEPDVHKTWCAVGKSNTSDRMIDYQELCRLSGARARVGKP
jgi:hypothetical protein